MTAGLVARLRGVDWRGVVFALAIGTAGGWMFEWFRMPLGWLMGAMFASTAAALAGVRLAIPKPLHATMVAVLGLMLGGGFSQEMIGHVARWATTIASLVPYVVVVAGLAALYLHRIIGYDARTAVFAAVPGGFIEMTTLAREMGADVRTVALIHSVRVLITVFSLPIWFRVVEGYIAPPGGAFAAGRPPPGLEDIGVLAACAAVGIVVARAVRLPGGVLLGPLFASAVAHLVGLTESRPPDALIAVAQVIVGTGIGVLFLGIPRRQVLTTMSIGLGMVAIMLGATLGSAYLLALATGFSGAVLLVAYAPGGLSEMGLVALALGMDVAFVATHHVARLLLIVISAPLAAKLLDSRLRRRSGGPSG